MQENSNKDVDERGGDEELPVPGRAAEHRGEGEPNSSAEAAVGNYDFLLPTDLVGSVLVEEKRKSKGDQKPEKVTKTGEDTWRRYR